MYRYVYPDIYYVCICTFVYISLSVGESEWMSEYLCMCIFVSQWVFICLCPCINVYIHFPPIEEYKCFFQSLNHSLSCNMQPHMIVINYIIIMKDYQQERHFMMTFFYSDFALIWLAIIITTVPLNISILKKNVWQLIFSK